MYTVSFTIERFVALAHSLIHNKKKLQLPFGKASFFPGTLQRNLLLRTTQP